MKKFFLVACLLIVASLSVGQAKGIKVTGSIPNLPAVNPAQLPPSATSSGSTTIIFGGGGASGSASNTSTSGSSSVSVSSSSSSSGGSSSSTVTTCVNGVCTTQTKP